MNPSPPNDSPTALAQLPSRRPATRPPPSGPSRVARGPGPAAALALACLALGCFPNPFLVPSHGQSLGFLNLDIPVQPVAISHPLLSSDSPAGVFPNRFDDILFDLPDGFRVRRALAAGGWRTNTFANGSWSDPDMTLLPGEAALLESPQPIRLTFAGTLPTGTLRSYLPAGRSLVGAPLPLEGQVFTDLHLPRLEGLAVLTPGPDDQWLVQGRIVEGQWVGTGPEPTVRVAEGFMVDSPRSLFWEIEFPPEPPAVAIEFISIPVDSVLQAGNPLTLEARVANDTGLLFQWRKNGTNIPGANGPVFHLDRTRGSDTGDYWLVAYGPDRCQFSPLARVIVQSPPPRLEVLRTQDPEAVEVSIFGVDGERVDLEQSTDLRQWTVLQASLELPARRVILLPPGSNGAFYRARVQ